MKKEGRLKTPDSPRSLLLVPAKRPQRVSDRRGETTFGNRSASRVARNAQRGL
jgi:hypothetical protein